MIFDITRRLQRDVYEWNGLELKLDCSFDNIFRCLELLGDDVFNEFERVVLILELLVINHEELEGITPNEMIGLMKDIFKDECDIDLGKKEQPNEEPVWDIYEDGERIYSSFLKDYGIDLYEQQGKMHYRKFTALLLNLHEETAFKKVVGYRVMKVPKPDKYNQEYRNHILEMKETYRLGSKLSDEERQERQYQQLMAFAKGLVKDAKVKE